MDHVSPDEYANVKERDGIGDSNTDSVDDYRNFLKDGKNRV
jgi:hypothetical protein